MAISPKPARAPVAAPADVDALIDRGLKRSEPESEAPAKTEIGVSLVLPTAQDTRIQRARRARPVKISRHQWILEAVEAQLQREGF